MSKKDKKLIDKLNKHYGKGNAFTKFSKTVTKIKKINNKNVNKYYKPVEKTFIKKLNKGFGKSNVGVRLADKLFNKKIKPIKIAKIKIPKVKKIGENVRKAELLYKSSRKALNLEKALRRRINDNLGFDIGYANIKNLLGVSKKHLITGKSGKLSVVEVRKYNASVKKALKASGMRNVVKKGKQVRGAHRLAQDIIKKFGGVRNFFITYASDEDKIRELKQQFGNVLTRDDISYGWKVSPKDATDAMNLLEARGLRVL